MVSLRKGVEIVEFDTISPIFDAITLFFTKCLYLCFVQTKAARTMNRKFTMQALSQLAMNVERVFNEIQAMPLGKSVKKFDFEFTGDPSVDAVEEVAVLFKGRPTDAHLDCLASILEAFPDKVVEGSTGGGRIGLR